MFNLSNISCFEYPNAIIIDMLIKNITDIFKKYGKIFFVFLLFLEINKKTKNNVNIMKPVLDNVNLYKTKFIISIQIILTMFTF